MIFSLFQERLERALAAYGAKNQVVDAAGFAEQRFERLRVMNVRFAYCKGAGGRCDGLVAMGFAAACGPDFRSRRSRGFRCSQADAGGAADDDDSLSVQFVHCRSVSCFR